VKGDTWEAKLPNRFFGNQNFNPFADEIHGDWFNPKGRKHHTGAVYLNGHWLTEAAKREDVLKPAGKNPLWFGRVDKTTTFILAQFPGADPNKELVEVNVRRTVFYPSKTGVNYITVRGFVLEQAATPWAPPTAEQIGLVGTNWSKGWIIENNIVRYSVCSGIALGKHGDQWDNTSQNSAVGYVKTIERAVKRGWSKENIGHHIVRYNEIAYCEQAGIVGSLGAIFSRIFGNEIHDIHVRRLFTGAEMAGIKIHAAIDTIIRDNHIHHTVRGIWLDWMNQGSRVTRNLLHDNGPNEDLYVEVNHGPYLVDHNLFLSKISLKNWSEGGAFAHNVFAGRIFRGTGGKRQTPYHPAHSAKVAGLSKIRGGDDRFYNNIFVGPAGLACYDKKGIWPVQMAGNVFLKGAKPSTHETHPLVLPKFDPKIEIVETLDNVMLKMNLDKSRAAKAGCRVVTTELLGKTKVSKLPFVQPDGLAYRLDTDWFGESQGNPPMPGPFGKIRKSWQVWPSEQSD
jgi:alpha-N-arabinofuranosidase